MIKEKAVKLGRRTATTLAATSLALLGSVSTAQAGGSCTVTGCSEFTNGSHLGVLAVQNWTCSTGTTATASTGCVSLSSTKWVYPTERTPSGQDWDAFRVDAGYCYKVEFLNEFPLLTKRWTMTYDRSNSSTPVYVKIENPSQAYIIAQKAGSCP